MATDIGLKTNCQHFIYQRDMQVDPTGHPVIVFCNHPGNPDFREGNCCTKLRPLLEGVGDGS